MNVEIVDIIKALSDANRLRIVNLLLQGELCVCDIERITKLSQSNLSKHLNKLRMVGLIEATKRAQWVFYTLNKDYFEKYSFLHELFGTDLQHGQYLKDRAARNAIEDLSCSEMKKDHSRRHREKP